MSPFFVGTNQQNIDVHILPISDVMRFLMYARCDGELETAKSAINAGIIVESSVLTTEIERLVF